MKHLYGFILIIWLAISQITASGTDPAEIAFLLGALCLFIIKEKYFDNIVASFLYLAAVLAFSSYNVKFVLLSGIPILDFMYCLNFPVSAITLLAASSIAIYWRSYENVILLASSAFIGFIIGTGEKNLKKHIEVLDNERRLRYNLEQVKNELIKSKKEIEHLAEIRERNRIAQEIHDSIGHSIAGVIFQLEAAIRLIGREKERAGEIMHLCSRKLSETLELTRNTVVKIRAWEKTGIDRIESIIRDFSFCGVIFEHNGDFSTISASNMNILEANIKEALTNASRHSNARNLYIKVDIGSKNIRLYIKDDGVGCGNIIENMGLSGMRERVRNAGGTISIDGSSGFMIVCNLPAGNAEQEEVSIF